MQQTLTSAIYDSVFILNSSLTLILLKFQPDHKYGIILISPAVTTFQCRVN